MKEEKERERRRDLGILFLLLPLAIACMFCAGQRAIALQTPWSVPADMRSAIDANKDYLTKRSSGILIPPINPDILTLPPWLKLETPLAGVATLLANTTPPAQVTAASTQAATSAATSVTSVATSVSSPPPCSGSCGGGGGGGGGSTPTADLQITKSDSSSTYDVGGSISYTIVVSNASGTTNVNGATVKDTFPAALSSISWTCASAGCGNANGVGNINENVNLAAGSSITYTISANISSSASGNLSNTATVTLPGGVNDPAPGNNSATDTDTPVFNVDLQITKDDSVTTYTPGSSVTYTVVVTNSALSLLDAVSSGVSDIKPSQVSSWDWVCAGATGGASGCTQSLGLTTDFSDNVDLPVGSSITYTVTAYTSSSATGSMTNTASVSAPVGYTDTNGADNSATDTDTTSSSSDLSVTKTDGASSYTASQAKTYTIVVSNAGPSDATGATVTDTFSTNSNITYASVGWSCIGTGSATCGGSGSGDISDSIDIPVGEIVTYTVNITTSGSPSGNLTNTASVSLATDGNGSNNSAADGPGGTGDQLFTSSGPSSGAIGQTKDNAIGAIGTGGSVILTFGTPLIVSSSDSDGYDLIYYEEPAGSGILLDKVIIEISDGSNWYTVFNWGNAAADTNSSVSILLGAPNLSDCSGEPDNCDIYGGVGSPFLVSTTGVQINVDGIGIPAGTYLYVRITDPGTGDGIGLDGIEVVP